MLEFIESLVSLLDKIENEVGKPVVGYSRIVGEVSKFYAWWVESIFTGYSGSYLDNLVAEYYGVPSVVIEELRLFRNKVVHYSFSKKLSDYGYELNKTPMLFSIRRLKSIVSMFKYIGG